MVQRMDANFVTPFLLASCESFFGIFWPLDFDSAQGKVTKTIASSIQHLVVQSSLAILTRLLFSMLLRHSIYLALTA